MKTIFPAPLPTLLPIENHGEMFPVRRVFCVGRNYAEHAREMGYDPDREPPFFFTKPADAVTVSGQRIPYPPQTENLHYEAELVAAIGTGGRDIAADKALDHVIGYAAGNDLTRRDIQAAAKKDGRPWDMAKGFDRAAIVGAITLVSDAGHLPSGRIRGLVNGDVRQDSDLSKMIWPLPDVIAFLSASVELAPGDLIMTGTPEGVGPLVSGDTCRVEIEGLAPCEVTIT